jgi:hypothetical protein
MPEVNCTVSNCHYWQQANLCGAESILITAGPSQGKDRHGNNAAILEGTPVGANQESYCLTFRPEEAAYVEDEEELEVADSRI